MLLAIPKRRSACCRVVWLPIGVVCCPGTHPCWNCTLDISPCVGKFKQKRVANCTAVQHPVCIGWCLDHVTAQHKALGSQWLEHSYLDHVTTTQGTWITLTGTQGLLGSRDYNTRHLDHIDWNTSYLDHVTTTQGTWITLTGTQVTWIAWLQHKALGSHWLEQPMLGWRDWNPRHINHNDWNRLYLDHVTETQIVRYSVIFNMNHLDDPEYFLISS